MDNYRFMFIFDVKMCNPMPDPRTGQPRITWDDGCGFITPQAIKYRIKKYWHEQGENVLHYEKGSEYTVFRELNAYDLSDEELHKKACRYIDYRCFGAMDLASDKRDGKEKKKGILKIKGPVSFSFAETVDPITTSDYSVNRSYRVDTNEDGSNQGSSYANDLILVDYGLYTCFGGVNSIEGKSTDLTDEDIEKMFHAMAHLYDNDYSSMRPMGSMNVRHLFVWRWGEEDEGISNTRLMNSISIQHKEGVVKPSSYNDYIIKAETLSVPVEDYAR